MKNSNSLVMTNSIRLNLLFEKIIDIHPKFLRKIFTRFFAQVALTNAYLLKKLIQGLLLTPLCLYNTITCKISDM